MKILTISTIFLLVSSTFAYPSKPLDERSTELTWQAWLLVDDQNQNKQYNEDGNVKKKVIAKSVFIVPTFNPEKLPPCAEGYASDSMGRCLEVFQVDAKNQLRFLLNKLQSHLESSHKTSSGPEKFTIEIPETDSSNDDTSAALVLTQNPKSDEKTINNMIVSHGNSNLPKIKVEDKNSEGGMETITSTPTTSDTTETETTTIDPASMEQVFSTISSFGDEMDAESTVTVLANEDTTEMMPMTFITTEDNRQAIFFKLPATTTQKNEQSSEISLSSRIQFKEDAFSNDQPSTQDSTNLDYVNSSKVIFKHSLETGGDLLTSENVRHTTNVIRFPDDHQQNFKYNSGNSDLQSEHLGQSNSFSHRNRDKNFWRLRPNDHNSFVVTLSNANFRDLLVQSRHSSPMYRQIPAEHLSYIFGRRSNNR